MSKGITIDFNANVVRFTSSVDKMTSDLAKFQTHADRIGKNVDKSFARLGSGLQGIFGGLAAGLSLRELGQMAESFTNIQARLKLATRDATEFAEANANIRRIAESSAAPLESTANLYTRISQSLLDVGGTQQQIANTTQALALSLRISGATAAESASAMQQFSQAVSSGVLRGEEFNAVNESAPRVMKALADSLGLPVGALRKLAEEGKLTRDILVEGLGSQLPKLIKESETLPVTMGAAWQDATNQLFLAVGEIDRLTGASAKAAEAIGSIGKAISRLRGGLESGGSIFGWVISTPEEEANAAATVASLEQKVARMKKMRDELSAPTAANWINDFIFGDVRDLDAQIATIEKKISHLSGLAKKAVKIDKVEQPSDPEVGMKSLLAKAEADKRAAEAAKEAEKRAKEAASAAKALANQQKTFIDGLQKEADQLGMTAAQMKVYEAGLLGISGARLSGVKQNAERIAAFEQEQGVLEEMRGTYAEAADSYLKFIQAVESDNRSATEKVDRLKLELSLMDETESARKKLLAQYDLEIKYKERLKELDGIDTGGERIRKIQEEGIARAKAGEEEILRVQELIDAQKKAAAETQKVWDNFGWNFQRNIGDQLYDTLNGNFDDIGQRWKSMLLRMLSDAIAADLSNALFGKQGFTGLLSMFGSLLGSFGSLGGSGSAAGGMKVTSGGISGFAAKGAYFDGAVSAFANGGIVNSPTMFKFAEGGSFKTGLMGEAGPEAIMPLKRDSKGRLGVSGGGGVTVNDNRVINIDSRSDRASIMQDIQRMNKQSNAELVERLSRQGAI